MKLTNGLQVCDVCGIALSDKEISSLKPFDYYETCYGHRHLANQYDIDSYIKIFGSIDYVANADELINGKKKA